MRFIRILSGWQNEHEQTGFQLVVVLLLVNYYRVSRFCPYCHISHGRQSEHWSGEACEKLYKWLLNDWQWNGGWTAAASWSFAPREAVTVSDEFRSAAPLGPAITRQDLVGERRERNQIMGCGYPASQPAGFFWDQRLAEASLSSRS